MTNLKDYMKKIGWNTLTDINYELIMFEACIFGYPTKDDKDDAIFDMKGLIDTANGYNLNGENRDRITKLKIGLLWLEDRVSEDSY